MFESLSLDRLSLESIAAASTVRFDFHLLVSVAKLVINISKQRPVSFTTGRWRRSLQQPKSCSCHRLVSAEHRVPYNY